MVPNAPKFYEMHQNIFLGSNAVDRVRSLQKIATRLCGTNFCTITTVWHRVLYLNQTVPNAPKLYETHRHMSLGSNGVDRAHSLWKILLRLLGTNFCTSSARFAPSFVTQPNGRNAPKLYEMHQNISLGPNRIYRVRLFWKISMRLRATNFCTSSARFAPSFVSQPNGPKCTKIVRNAPNTWV